MIRIFSCLGWLLFARFGREYKCCDVSILVFTFFHEWRFEASTFSGQKIMPDWA